ncbi:hypothetical protein BS50DRAFT_579417 [Corynespora cassiicola Philippines]|uniref:Celp0028 effector like protein n=1 Tax=Corynespora cassiicola Philippines TaxID=1448308 RepID=A0A2T2N4C4_CORCC|nr:hypothetical protein BS50DRAFT_579417 [Corynespora cassiicola Philippines]
MQLTSAFALASSLALVSAFPTPDGASKPITVRHDDVVLVGEGRFEVMKRSEFAELEQLRKSSIPPPAPGHFNASLKSYSGPELGHAVSESNTSSHTKRKNQNIIIPNEPQRFLGWDVLMSQVVKGAPTTIYVGTGYEISNEISVGVGLEVGLISDFLSVSTSVDYSNSWTSTQSQELEAEVPEGMYGAFVINPWTNRQSGYIWTGDMGKLGAGGSRTYWQADSFESRKYGDLAWVDGLITLCTGAEFPLKRCMGEGTL